VTAAEASSSPPRLPLLSTSLCLECHLQSTARGGVNIRTVFAGTNRTIWFFFRGYRRRRRVTVVVENYLNYFGIIEYTAVREYGKPTTWRKVLATAKVDGDRMLTEGSTTNTALGESQNTLDLNERGTAIRVNVVRGGG